MTEQTSKLNSREHKVHKTNFIERFYGFYSDSSYRTRVALVEVDLCNSSIKSWEPLTDFQDCPEFKPNKVYNFNNLSNFLKRRVVLNPIIQTGHLVMYYPKDSVLILVFTVKKIDVDNSNSSEILCFAYINTRSLDYTFVFKSENHIFENSGQIFKHSQVYALQGNFS